MLLQHSLLLIPTLGIQPRTFGMLQRNIWGMNSVGYDSSFIIVKVITKESHELSTSDLFSIIVQHQLAIYLSGDPHLLI